MNKIMVEKEIMPEWGRKLLLEEVRAIDEFMKSLGKKDETMEHLKKQLKEHWENTKEKRERTHTTKIYQKIKNKKGEINEGKNI